MPTPKGIKAALPDYLSPGAVRGTIGADRSGHGQLCVENSVSGWDYACGVQSGRPSVAGFQGQTGSAGAQASNESHGAAFMPLGAGTISWSACIVCGGPMRIIVGMPNHSIEDPMVIEYAECHETIMRYLEWHSIALALGSESRISTINGSSTPDC